MQNSFNVKNYLIQTIINNVEDYEHKDIKKLSKDDLIIILINIFKELKYNNN